MNKENNITLTIETPAIGNIITEIPYDESENDNGRFILKIPNRKFCGIDHTNLDLTYVVEQDVELFRKMNERSDANHQVTVDTLTVYGIKISGNYIRVQYWFHQDNDSESHRMCAGQLVHSNSRGNYLHKEGEITRIFNECYSSDVCVYW